MEIPVMENKDFSLNNLQWNKENIWIGKYVFKFYHSQRCPECNYCTPGYNDLETDGPWSCTCPKCEHQWSIAMTPPAKENRKKLLHIMKTIDSLIDQAKALDPRRYVRR